MDQLTVYFVLHPLTIFLMQYQMLLTVSSFIWKIELEEIIVDQHFCEDVKYWEAQVPCEDVLSWLGG
jgi:hypothetical protein